MAREDNLQPGNVNHTLTPEEQQMGGKASGKARRAKKNMQELAKIILNMSITNGEVHSVEDMQSIADIKGKNLTVDQMILLKQVEKALKGDLQSATFVRDTSGNKPVEVQQVVETPIINDNI